ncbi:hypothetical protein EJB05_01442, partial [Eragrostis curvula]
MVPVQGHSTTRRTSTPASASAPAPPAEEPMIFAGREDVEILLNEKMKGENNMAFKVAPPHLLLLLSWLQPELVSLELDLFHPDYVVFFIIIEGTPIA